jgi:hypothetical protein
VPILYYDGEWLARWADGKYVECFVPQGVALGWVNGWPFGPKSIVNRDKIARDAIFE